MVLDAIFSPLLKLHPLIGLIILSFLISLIITLIQKFTTNQTRLKEIKEEMKSHQKRMKEVSKEDPQKAMKMQKESMKLTMETMKHSMRSMLYSFIPIILIFSWMSSNLAYNPISQDEEFVISLAFEEGAQGEVEIDIPPGLTTEEPKVKPVSNNEVEWTLKGKEGEHLIEFTLGDDKERKEVLIIDEQRYKSKDKTKSYFTFIKPKEGFIDKDSLFNKITLEYDKKIYINFLGGMGWLLTYILFSIAFSIIIRKVIKVY